MDLWCQHVKWKKPSQHCLKCLNAEVEQLRTEVKSAHQTLITYSQDNVKLRKALEDARSAIVPLGNLGSVVAAISFIDEALKDSK